MAQEPPGGHLGRGSRAADEARLRAAYEAHAAALYGYLRHILGDDRAAEDVLQDVFVTLWLSFDRYDPERGSLRAWLMTIARSRAIDRLRQNQAAVALEVATVEAAGRSAALPAVGDESHLTQTELAAAVAALPPEQRRAVRLVYYLGLSQREAARRLAIPLGTLKGRLRLGVGRLRRWLEAQPGRNDRER